MSGVRLLTVACLINTALVVVLGWLVLRKPAELSAERLTIVGPDGKPLLILAARSRIPGPYANGKEYPRAVADGREYLSGLIFLNEQGDEVGGLLFNGITKEGGGYSSVGHLSFDQWKQNQVIALQYIDSGKTRRAGLNVWDRPTDVPFETVLQRRERMLAATGPELEALEKEAAAARAHEEGVPRVFLGSQDRTAQLVLRDTKGRIRARLAVDASDAPRLEFLDEGGKTVSSYP